MIKAIPACRICESRELTSLIDLGEQYLTGIFPATPNQPLTRGTLELIKCDLCGLVQLRHTYDLTAMYGPTYGYRSGLNKSMVAHLQAKTAMLQKLCPLKPGDAVLDIGSSDSTLLNSYPQGIKPVGIDPSAEKFRQYYRPEAKLIVDFFSAEVFRRQTDVTHAKIVTSIAMFYDLEMPLSFVEQVRNILAPDGVWHLEQSYLPLMLKVNAYDTICHEHLEYYGLKQIKWMMDRARLKIIDVQLNDINGGSFAITVAHEKSSYPEATEKVNRMLQEEKDMGLDGLDVFKTFKERVFKHRDELIHKLQEFKRAGKLVLGYGASTKGNVILQFCGITSDLLPAIMEVNPDKFGCYTPGTKIPIISEMDGHGRQPDYLLVLPWHFKENVIQREAAYLKRGGKLLFPLAGNSHGVKTAVIVGAGGQDGFYLTELLQQRGYAVTGLTRDGGTDILKRDDVFALMERVQPDECYYLAAFHHSSEDKELQSNDSLLFERSYAVHVQGLLHFLDAIAHVSPKTKLFYAASSHVFGAPATQPQTELTPLEPTGVYGITKTMGIHCCRYFRRERGVFAAVGILYNHESPRRATKFLSQKIVRGVLAFQKDNSKRVVLGDLAATVDWGYAPDYADAMTRILAQPAADEYIVATGQPHTVEDFLRATCESAGVNWRNCVETKPGLLTKKSVLLVGDSSKLQRATGWKPSVSFKQMIPLLVEDARRAHN